ncbi:DMT family transporter [Rhodobacter sp. 24-YEA-8]|uniref:EamA family transporter n=1 Tax=Rhodobacter sp. 24-YEA-8 TaxID=1884310 RepID=UPI00089847B0|nr:EamA family transporter [Rhodobacter sp. 24-YEA-8]SED62652.1 inner membrane transporter RhtA [Rhodobacter sp. 24-YEA-8]
MSVSQSRSRAVLPYLALVAAFVMLPLGTAFSKQLFPLVGAAGTAFYRVGFAAFILLLLWRPWRRAWSRQELLSMVAYGGALSGMTLCFFMALRTLPLGITLAIELLGPLAMSALYARSLRNLLSVCLALGGVGLLLPIRQDINSLDPIGVGFALAAGAFWALYIICGARAAQVHPGHAVSLGLCFAALIIAPFGISSAGVSLLMPSSILLGLVAAAISAVIPYSLEMVALRSIPKPVFGVLLAAEPAMGSLIGALWLLEALSLSQITAIVLIVLAGIGAVSRT